MAKLGKGDKVPSLFFESEIGKKYIGKKIVLYFYPKDDTPGCTQEACNLRDNYELLRKNGFSIIGVSADKPTSHQKFKEKYSLPFDLISDTEKEIIDAFGVWGEKKMYGKTYMGIYRTTFLINEDGIISEIIEKVDTKNHSEQIVRK